MRSAVVTSSPRCFGAVSLSLGVSISDENSRIRGAGAPGWVLRAQNPAQLPGHAESAPTTLDYVRALVLSARTLALLAGLAIALLLPVTLTSAEPREPTPKELWDAYPLDPRESPPVATPGSEIGVPSSSGASQEDERALPWFVPLMLVAPLAVVAAMMISEHRRRGATTRPADQTAPTTPGTAHGSVDWHDYPPPARPAPPAPPAPPPLHGGGL
jgi:hypothetical protein